MKNKTFPQIGSDDSLSFCRKWDNGTHVQKLILCREFNTSYKSTLNYRSDCKIIDVPKPVTHIASYSWEEHIKRIKLMEDLVGIHLQYPTEITIEIPTELPFGVIWSADWHLGAPGIDYDSFEKDMSFIPKQKGMKINIGGDGYQNIIQTSKIGSSMNQTPICVQKGLYVLTLKKLLESIFAISTGNHNYWTTLMTGEDWDAELANRLHLVYLKHFCRINLVVGKQLYPLIRMHKSRYNCLSPETEIKLVNGTTKTIEELSHETEPYWVYGINPRGGEIVPTKATPAKVTGENVPIYEVFLDNGNSFKATGNHKVMIKQGRQVNNFKQVNELQSGDSLMPFNWSYDNKWMKGYELIQNPIWGKWHFTHRLFGGHRPQNNIIHHIDFNLKNNCPENLKIMTVSEHMKIHSCSKERRAKMSKLHKGKIISPENRKKVSINTKKLLSDPTYYNFWISRVREVAKSPSSRLNKSLGHMGCKHSEETKIKQGIGIRNYWKHRPRLSKFKGMTYEERFGIKRAKEIKEKVGIASRNVNRPHPSLDKAVAFIIDKLSQGETTVSHLIKEGTDMGISQRTIGWAKSEIGLITTRYKRKGKQGWIYTWKLPVINHKVVSVKYIGIIPKVYDIETETHNFGLACGIFVHNSSFNLTHCCKQNQRLHFPDARVVVVEHQHTGAIEQYIYNEKECVAIRTGTYAVYDDYALQNGYFGAHVCNPTVVFYPNEDKLVGFKDMRDAAVYLKAVRGDK